MKSNLSRFLPRLLLLELRSMPVSCDYSLRMFDYGNPNDFDDKLWEWISILKSYDRRLMFSYGTSESNRRPVSSKSDFRRARDCIDEMRKGLDIDPTYDIYLFMGIGDGEPTGSLTMLQTWDRGGYQWHLRLSPVDLIRLCGDPPHAAGMMFRRLLNITRPYRAEWEEQRNRALLRLDIAHDKQGRRVQPSWWSGGYPPEAVPLRWLISAGLYAPHHPSGVWWFNYWHPDIVSEFGRDVLRGLPVPHVEEMEDGGFLFWLCDELFTIDRPDHLKIQRLALEHLHFREHQIAWVEPHNRALLSEWHGPVS